MAYLNKARNEAAFLDPSMRASATFQTRQHQTITLRLKLQLSVGSLEVILLQRGQSPCHVLPSALAQGAPASATSIGLQHAIRAPILSTVSRLSVSSRLRLFVQARADMFACNQNGQSIVLVVVEVRTASWMTLAVLAFCRTELRLFPISSTCHSRLPLCCNNA